jgi:hypothetical protein
MSHMPSMGGDGVACTGGSCGGRIVSYVATGLEAPGGFIVPIGTIMPDATYHPSFFTVEADVIVPVAWSFPAASKTMTQFEARFAGDGLTAGATYYFELAE